MKAVYFVDLFTGSKNRHFCRFSEARRGGQKMFVRPTEGAGQIGCGAAAARSSKKPRKYGAFHAFQGDEVGHHFFGVDLHVLRSKLRASLLLKRHQGDDNNVLTVFPNLFTTRFCPRNGQKFLSPRKKSAPRAERRCEELATSILHVVVEEKLVGMRPQAKRVVLLAFVAHPHLQEVFREHIAFQEEFVILLQGIQRLAQ